MQGSFANASMYGKKERQGKTVASLDMCDRKGCNAIIRGNATAVIQLRLNSDPELEDNGYINASLCPACVEEIHQVYLSEPVTPRQRAYDKPYTGKSDDEDEVRRASAVQLAAALFEKLLRDPTLAIEAAKVAKDERGDG